MPASARTSGTSAPVASSLYRGSCASPSAAAAPAARAARRFRDREAACFLDAGGSLRQSLFAVLPHDRDVACWPARGSEGRPRATTVARRHRTRETRVGRLDIRRSNSLERRWL